MNLTDHGQWRLSQRAHGVDPDVLWSTGRTAIDADFSRFGTYAHEGATYRVAIKGGNAYLLARNEFGLLITVIRRR